MIEGQSNTEFMTFSVPIGSSQKIKYPKHHTQYPVIKYPKINDNTCWLSDLASDISSTG